MAVLRAMGSGANSRCLTQAARRNIDGESAGGRFPEAENDESRHKGRDSLIVRQAPEDREPSS